MTKIKTKSSSRITMADLAKLAEVDVSTVSRALNDSPLVKPDTKAHILKMANEVGYIINASARNLRRQSSQTIGMVIPIDPQSGENVSDPFFLEMMGAISYAASQEGYDLIVSVPKDASQIAEQRLLQSGRADGIIIIGQAGREARLNQVGPLAKNIVVWGGQNADTNYTVVGSNNIAGGYMATSHLLSLGRKKIVFIGNIDLPEVGLRYEGYKKACAEYDVPTPSDLVVNMGFGESELSRHEKIKALLAANPNIDGIFASSDQLAISAVNNMTLLGKNIPEDVSVIGYDNILQSANANPPITTIDQNISASGAKLVELLLNKINGQKVQSVMMPTNLIIRDSCGAQK